MRNLELIDDYLSNRLSEQERKDFEQKIESDAELKAELATQRQIVEGIKKARAAELKSMLAKVSIESTPTVSLTPLRIAAGLFGAAVLASVIYYFYDNDNAFTEIDEIVAEAIRIDNASIGDLTKYNGRLVMIDRSTFSCRVEIEDIDQVRKINGKIIDPVIAYPGNMYTKSFSDNERIEIEAKPLLRDSEIISLYISNARIL